MGISDGSSLKPDLEVQPSSFTIITGLSGSGKGTFLRALEDRSYFCVDNLPVGLLSKFYELVLKSSEEPAKAALVIDVREGQTLSELPSILEELRNDHKKTLRRVFDFLGVDSSFVPPESSVFEQEYADKIDNKSRSRLIDIFYFDIKELERLLKRDLSNWYSKK